MMEKTNLWSTGYLIIAILVTGEVFTFLSFANRHPAIIFNLFAVGLTSAIGQLFLYSMVRNIVAIFIILCIYNFLYFDRFRNMDHYYCRLLRQQENSSQYWHLLCSSEMYFYQDNGLALLSSS